MFEFKGAFFDSAKVIKAMATADRKAQSKFGAYVRTRARSLLRRRKKASSPGSPPSVHASGKYATLKNVLFGYDVRSRSTIVGPVLLRNKSAKASVPKLHEFGGSVLRPSGKTARYPARPFMAPALAAERPRFPNLFRASLRAA